MNNLNEAVTSTRRRPLTRSLSRMKNQAASNAEKPSISDTTNPVGAALAPTLSLSNSPQTCQEPINSNCSASSSISTTLSFHRLCICIVSDFFLPRLGGVELHQYQLAQALIARGHKVIVVTGCYGTNYERQGVRYLTQGLKVYYCPQISFHNQVSVPTLYGFFPLFRSILLREKVDIVHGHQTTSPLAHQCLLMAKLFPHIRTIYTDHSLFNFASPASVHVNKLMRFTLLTVDHVIAVSHTLRENVVLRAGIPPENVSVIPNAIDHTRFRPYQGLGEVNEERKDTEHRERGERGSAKETDKEEEKEEVEREDEAGEEEGEGRVEDPEPGKYIKSGKNNKTAEDEEDILSDEEMIHRAIPPLLTNCPHNTQWKFLCNRTLVNDILASLPDVYNASVTAVPTSHSSDISELSRLHFPGEKEQCYRYRDDGEKHTSTVEAEGYVSRVNTVGCISGVDEEGCVSTVDEEGWPLVYRAHIELEMERLASMANRNDGGDDCSSSDDNTYGGSNGNRNNYGGGSDNNYDSGGGGNHGARVGYTANIHGVGNDEVEVEKNAQKEVKEESTREAPIPSPLPPPPCSLSSSSPPLSNLCSPHSHSDHIPSLSEPSSLRSHPDRVRAIILSRLVYRKGLELACEAIPVLCHRHPYLDFIVGGDGPHRPLLENMVRKNKLEKRVFFLGEVPHHRVSEVLASGDFFLNTSLTESFCIAILEAAAAGLPVVSTRVGGVPEILAPGIIYFSDPNPVSLAMAVDSLLCRYCVKCVDKSALHAIVAKSYSWHSIAQRTEHVYVSTTQRPDRLASEHALQYWSLNSWSGRVWAGVIVLGMCIFRLCQWLWPEDNIDIVPDLNRDVLLHAMCSDKIIPKGKTWSRDNK